MQKNNEELVLENLNRHLQSMEKMLQKADEYNDTLAERINKLKDILRSNQKVFDKLQDNQQSMQKIFRGNSDESELNYELTQRLANIENKVQKSINYPKLKCLVSLS